MAPRPARVLVAISSAAVLVLEILAGRLLAPYVGVSLETFTGIIGVALAGIASGAWIGGIVADTVDARRFVGAAFALGGVFCFLVLPILGALGPQFGDGSVAIVMLSATTLFAPAAILSTVSPMIAKLMLGDLGQTGAVVGGLSAAGTLGALIGTFVTGFVLVAAVPTRLTILLLGASLIVIGAACHLYIAKAMPHPGLIVLVAAAGLLSLMSDRPCQYETGYFCADIVSDDLADPSGRSLYLDGIRHAYVDLDDPTNLDIRYIRLFASAAAALPPGPIESLHIGGGGFSFPRYIEHVRPASRALAVEIDSHLVTLAEDELGLVLTESLQVHVGDARRALDELVPDSFDLIVGDAFASRAVPWHLTTREFLSEVERVLDPAGLYVMNVIDAGEASLVQAELATLRQIFSHVVVVVPPDDPGPTELVNYVLIASQQPVDGVRPDPADGRLLDPRATAAFASDASPLRDDFAPVDQLQG